MPPLTRTAERTRPAKKSAVKAVANLSDRALRTRDKLKHAARELLNESGYRQLRIQDVTERAGVAAGLFYRYFHDLRELVHEVSSDFMAQLNTESSAQPVAAHPYDQIFQRHALALRLFERNPGIVRCLFQFDGDFPEFGQVWKLAAHDWNLQVARFLSSSAGVPTAQAEQMAFVLGAMTEGVLFQYLIRHTEDLATLGGNPDDIAEMLSVMWYRSIFLQDPPMEKLHAGRALIAPARK
jgi:AcrR family transcriptional regulator